MSKKQQPQKQEEPQMYLFHAQNTAEYKTNDTWVKEGKFVRMARSDFPAGRNGALAYAEYRIAQAVDYRTRITRRSDPLAKTRSRVEKMRAKLAAMEKELAAAEQR